MAGKVNEYERLAGRMRLGLVRGSLWLGRDHLLKVTSTGYSEEYKRFYLKDIQAIIVHRTASGALWSLFFGVIILLACLIGFAAVGGEGGVIFVLCVSIPLGILLTVNLAKGPTCLCRIRTAVQTEKIEALHRLNKAQEVLVRLRPIILEAQGGFTENDLAVIQSLASENAGGAQPDAVPQVPQEARPSGWAIVTEEPVRITLPDSAFQNPAGAPPAPAPADTSAAPPPSSSDGPVAPAAPLPPVAVGGAAVSRVARVNESVLVASATAAPVNVKTTLCTLAFGCVLLDCFLTLANIFHGGMAVAVANVVSGVAAMLLSIIAVARLAHLPIVSRVRRALLIYIFFVLILTFAASIYTYQLVASTGNPELIHDAMARIRWSAQHPVLESPVRLIMYLCALAGGLSISLHGLWQLRGIEAMRKAPAGLSAAAAVDAKPAGQES